MKKLTMIVLFALLTAGVAVAGSAPVADVADLAPVDLPAIAVEAAQDTSAAMVTGLPVAPVLVIGVDLAGHCPFNAPRCFQHSNCDSYCGAPGFGFCFSNGCCGCSG